MTKNRGRETPKRLSPNVTFKVHLTGLKQVGHNSEKDKDLAVEGAFGGCAITSGNLLPFRLLW